MDQTWMSCSWWCGARTSTADQAPAVCHEADHPNVHLVHDNTDQAEAAVHTQDQADVQAEAAVHAQDQADVQAALHAQPERRHSAKDVDWGAARGRHSPHTQDRPEVAAQAVPEAVLAP